MLVNSGELDIKNCSAGYGGKPVFSNLNLTFNPGDTVTLLGPSGCGKTTLLLTAAGLIKPLEGRVFLDGSPLGPADKRVGVILQNYGLFPWMTAEENVSLALKIQGGFKGKERSEKSRGSVAAVFSDLGLEGLEKRYPSQLSGGQQQRVAIGRTLVLNPSVLLMDEPFSALDAISREKMQDLLLRLLSGRDIITLFVTHSVEEAVFIGRKILLMHPSSGTGTAVIREYENPSGGSLSYRNDSSFFSLSRQVRAALSNADG